MPLLSTLVRGNIEESPRILYPFNYGEDIFLSFAIDRKTNIMDPMPHNTIISQKNPSVLNSLALQVFRIWIHSVLNPTRCLYSSYEKDKQHVTTNLEQRQKGSSDSGVSKINLCYSWGYDPRSGCIVGKGDSLLQLVLLVEGGSIHIKTPGWHLKLKQFPCTEAKGKFQSSAIVDLFQPKTALFSTRALISVHFKTVRYFSQPIFRLFSY